MEKEKAFAEMVQRVEKIEKATKSLKEFLQYGFISLPWAYADIIEKEITATLATLDELHEYGIK